MEKNIYTGASKQTWGDVPGLLYALLVELRATRELLQQDVARRPVLNYYSDVHVSGLDGVPR